MAAGLEYRGVASISGPIIIVENVQDVGFDELVQCEDADWRNPLRQSHRGHAESRNRPSFRRHHRLVAFGNPHTLSRTDPLEVPVSTEMLGRVMNSFGEPIDGHPQVLHRRKTRRKRVPTESDCTRVPTRLHPNRHLRNRRLKQPCAWTEASSLQRSRLSAQ